MTLTVPALPPPSVSELIFPLPFKIKVSADTVTVPAPAPGARFVELMTPVLSRVSELMAATSTDLALPIDAPSVPPTAKLMMPVRAPLKPFESSVILLALTLTSPPAPDVKVDELMAVIEAAAKLFMVKSPLAVTLMVPASPVPSATPLVPALELLIDG